VAAVCGAAAALTLLGFSLGLTEAAPSADWPTYFLNAERTSSQTDPFLSPQTAAKVINIWQFPTRGVIASQAAVVNNVVYVGSWDGFEYAIDAFTGRQIWKTFLGVTVSPPANRCAPPSAGVTSTATVQNGVLYLGGGDNNWYALDAASGRKLWSVPTANGTQYDGHYNWSSAAIANGFAYIGLASLADCPLVQGQLLRVDLQTHQIAGVFDAVQDGELGAGIWTSPAFEAGSNTVWVTTGNRTGRAADQAIRSEALLALDGTTLGVKDSWALPLAVDLTNGDPDWGTTPVLFSDASGRHLLAAINKNGILYVFDRTNLHDGPVWTSQIARNGDCPVCGDGSVSTPAFGQGQLYAAGGITSINGVQFGGSVRAFDPATGRVRWEHGTSRPVVPGLAYVNGLVIACNGATVEILDASTGKALWSYTTGNTLFGAPSVSNGRFFVGSTDMKIYAFAVPAAQSPPDPTATPVPSTATPLPSATATSVPAPTATSTPVPPPNRTTPPPSATPVQSSTGGGGGGGRGGGGGGGGGGGSRSSGVAQSAVSSSAASTSTPVPAPAATNGPEVVVAGVTAAQPAPGGAGTDAGGSIQADGSVVSRLSDSLSVFVPRETAEGRKLVAQLTAPGRAPNTTAVPSLPDGFHLVGDFFLITESAATDRSGGAFAAPLTVTYHPPASVVEQAGGLDHLRIAFSDASWVALPCSAGADRVLSCSVPHAGLFATLVVPTAIAPLDAPLAHGWFYRQANGFSGAGPDGFRVVDDDQARLWSEFQRLGGLGTLGYPISERFEYQGFLTQAFQKLVLQWRPELGRAVPVNLLDDLNGRGTDGWLDRMREVPPAADTQADSGLTWEQVVARHTALLDAYPALHDFYMARPDALEIYGLPLSVKDYGTFVAVRLQRATFQLAGGQHAAANVLVGNTGDLAKEAGLWPVTAVAPVPRGTEPAVAEIPDIVPDTP
jgi:outer membrane protein assembly factor BamB